MLGEQRGEKRKRKYLSVIVWIILCCHMEFNCFFKKRRCPFQCYLFYNRNFPFLHPFTSRSVLFSIFNPSWKVTVVLQERPPSLSHHSWMLWIGLCFSEAEIHQWEGALGAAEYCPPLLEVKYVTPECCRNCGRRVMGNPTSPTGSDSTPSASWPPFHCTPPLISINSVSLIDSSLGR